MPNVSESQRKQEFNENFEIMNESKEALTAYTETFLDQTNAENLLATGGGENLGSIESELASLAVMNEIRLSQRQEAFVESSLFTTKVDLKVRNKSFLDGTGEIGRRKAIKSHRYDKTRKNRAETANETMTRANDKIRTLQKKLRGENGAGVPDKLQKVSALEEIYDNIRVADRNFAEALSLNKAEEKKLKDKAELTYRASLKRMYEREMEGLDHNSREYIKIKRKYDENLRVYNELKGAMQQAQAQIGAQEQVHANAQENQVLPAANQEAEAVLEPVDKEAEELVSKNVELFKKFAEKFDDGKYGGKVIPAWTVLKRDTNKLVGNWNKLKDYERGHILGKLLISANMVLADEKEDGGVGKERLSAVKTCRNFLKTILNSMSDNCRVIALDEVFKQVDRTEESTVSSDVLKEENKAFFAEMSRDLLEKNGQLQEAEKNKDFVIGDFYRAQYALDKYLITAENVKKVFGNTKDFAIANMKFRFDRFLSAELLGDSFRLDRYGRVVQADEEKVEKWRKLFSEMANCDTSGALKFQREFFARVGKTPVDKTFASKNVLRKKYYEFKSFSLKVTNTSDFANYFEDMTPESIKRKVDAWNAQHPEDKISEKDIKILDKNKLLEQNEKLAALPVFDVMRKVQLSLDNTGFVSHLITGKGMAIGSDVKLNDEEKLKNIDNAIEFVLTGKEVTFNWQGAFCPLIHKDGTAFDPDNDTKEITDPKDRTKRIRVLKQNKKNPLVLSMDYYQVKAKEEIKKQTPILDKAEISMEKMEKRQAQLYTVENGAMDRLRALCTNKLSAEGKAELKKLEATFEEFLCDVSIEFLEMERLDQIKIKTADGTQAEFSHRSRIYDAHKKKMDALYKKIDAAQRSFIKKYVGDAAYKNWKKELDTYRGASQEKGEKFVKVTTSKDAASSILEGNYDNIEQVKQFKKNMGSLYSLLSNKMPPLNFDSESVDATCLLVATVYNDVITSIDACLGIDRNVIKNADFFKQIEKVKELCVKEKALFRQNVFEYREMLAQSDELDEEYQNPTWLHAIKYLRAEHYNINNKKGIKTEIKGSGASIRYKMTEKKDGEENTMWFSKEEKVASGDTTTLFTEYVDSLDFDEAFKERAIKPVFDALLNDFRMKPFIGDQPILRFIVGLRTSEPGEIIQSMRAAGLDAEQEFSKLSDEDKKVVSTQLKEFSKHIFQREICAKSAKIDYGRNISNRNVATSRMAQLFGIQNIISDSRTATVQNGNTTIMGNVMEDAKGFKASDVTNKAGNKVVYGENAINQTFCMMVFDLICGQVDRHFANFYMQFDKDEKKKVTKITGIKAFDNDVAFGRLTFNDVKEGYNRIRPATHLHLKGLPISMVNTIMHLEREVIDHLLCDILDKKELDALWNRLSGIKNRIPQLEGIAYNEETHRYYYTGEDADDTLRQLKQLKAMTKVFPGEEISEYTSFHHTLVSPQILDQMIAGRRKELGINTR